MTSANKRHCSTTTAAGRKRVGLALSSGSSRGWAHIGAIEALEAEQIPIDIIAGCSVGAYVGAVYAGGGMSSLKDFVLRMNGQKIFSYFDVVFPRSGLLDGTRKVKELFQMHSKARTFEELSIPLMMVATDLESGGRVVLNSGDLLAALRATMSLPGLFAPARINDHWLLDGGLVDPVPVGLAKSMGADIVIAVDLNSGLLPRRDRWRRAASPQAEPLPLDEPASYRNEWVRKFADYYENAESTFKQKIREMLHKEIDMPDIVETVTTAIGIMQERITRVNLAVEPPDVLVQPRLGELHMMDFDQVDKAIEEGYLGVRDSIEDIRMLLKA
ncbi:MAG: patatin-like phospholipase family protein [Desulfosarcina sp.]|nr:patatin-like phospholipase family protein [Desulfobacterales bacterium]